MRVKLVHSIIILAVVLSVVAPSCPWGGTSNVLINELLPDPFGMDEDVTGPKNGGHEMVELVNLGSQAADITNWTLKNAQGDILMTFPPGTIIPGMDIPGNHYYYLVVILGSEIASLVDDFGDAYTPYSKTIFLGSDQGDLIDNSNDALVLENAGNQIIDALLFGTQMPSGPQVGKVTDDNHWVGTQVDTSFDSGIPLGGVILLGDGGGGILGRDRDSTDSNSAGDWRVDGGVDALGGTFGGENSPNRFYPDFRALLHGIQDYINEIAALLSTSNTVPPNPYLGITNAYYANVDTVVSDDNYYVTAEHYFDYSMLDTVTGTLSGNLIAVYNPTSGQSDSLEVSGTLTDPINGNSLAVFIHETMSGFGTASHTLTLDITVTWTEPSGSYSYHNSASWVETWVAQDSMTIIDHREGTDWSNPDLKVSHGTYDIQYVADGVATADFTLERPIPYWAGAFGEIQPPSTSSEVAHFQCTTTINSDGEVSRDFTIYDIFLDDGITETKYMELDSGEQGSLILVRTGGVAGDYYVGTYNETVDLPLTIYYGGTIEDHINVTLDKEITREFITNPAGDEVFVDRATIIIQIDDVEKQRFYYYIDGWLSKLCKVVAAVACGGGALVTAPSVVGGLAFVAASAVVVTAWEVVEEGEKK